MALGQILREARESKGMTIAEAAEATRILFPVIEGLETEDFRRIAAPIYGRGFIKIYAEVLGLDPNPLLNDYAELQAGGGKIRTFSHPTPLLPPKREPVSQTVPAAEESKPDSESAPVAEKQLPTEDFFLATEELSKPRRRDYSFVPGNQQEQIATQAKTPEKNWLFSRDRTQPVFSKSTPKPPRKSIQMPKIKIPGLRIPPVNLRIPEGLKEKLAGLKYPAMSPTVKKAAIFVSAALCVLLLASGLRLVFKPSPVNTADRTALHAQQAVPEIHVKAIRIPLPDPYID